jgi:hypothetical protein
MNEMAGSRWVKLDSDYPDNPKIAPLSHAAFRLHITMIAYCAKELTDGHLSAIATQVCITRASLAHRSRHTVVAELHTAGLLEACGTGWVLHDFLDMNPQLERSVVENRRKKWRAHKQVNGHEFPTWNPQQIPRA